MAIDKSGKRSIKHIGPPSIDSEIEEAHYRVRFLKTDIPNRQVKHGEAVILPDHAVKEGKKLTGWKIDGKTYNPGEGLAVYSDVDATPIWSNTISFDALIHREKILDTVMLVLVMAYALSTLVGGGIIFYNAFHTGSPFLDVLFWVIGVFLIAVVPGYVMYDACDGDELFTVICGSVAGIIFHSLIIIYFEGGLNEFGCVLCILSCILILAMAIWTRMDPYRSML